MSGDGSGKPRARDDVVFRRVGEAWLLFDPRTQLIHELNLTAAVVWSFCTGEHTSDEIRSQVEAAFQEVPGEEGHDATGAPDPVAAALERFAEEGLLEANGEG